MSSYNNPRNCSQIIKVFLEQIKKLNGSPVAIYYNCSEYSIEFWILIKDGDAQTRDSLFSAQIFTDLYYCPLPFQIKVTINEVSQNLNPPQNYVVVNDELTY